MPPCSAVPAPPPQLHPARTHRHHSSHCPPLDRAAPQVDKVSLVVSSTRPDTASAQYQATIKQGDLLLNRLQKLSRVINI